VSAINRFGRPWWGNHRGWYHGAWSNWAAYPSFWAGLTGGYWLTPWATGSSFVYDNPYYVEPAYGLGDVYAATNPALDYSQALAVPTDTQATDTDEDTVTQAMSHFAQARALFKRRDYPNATAEVDAALQLLSGDRTMHEFRALTLFARGMYTDAAAAIYAVLAEGPGWDWDTMAALYDSTDTYTQQLRKLEAYVASHPEDGPAHFLLGYHYLVLDNRDAAIAELRASARLTPQDKLSSQLADALSKAPPNVPSADQ
jgi:tetratricopeptide (TPR) repeat protein